MNRLLNISRDEVKGSGAGSETKTSDSTAPTENAIREETTTTTTKTIVKTTQGKFG